MIFNDRKIKCKKIQKTDLNGIPLSGEETFYALITDEVIEEGTPLNAENLNLRDVITGEVSPWQDILNNMFNLLTEPITVQEYDALGLTRTEYDSKNIAAIKFDIRGRTLLLN